MESSLKSLSLSVADDDDDEDNNNDEDLPDYREATESSLSKLDLAANNDDSDEEDDHNFTNSNSRRPSSNTISGYSVNPHSILPPLFPVTQQQQLSCNPSVEVGGSSGITLLRRPRLQHELSSASMDSIISNKSKHSSKASTDDDDDDDESGGGSSSKLQLKTTSSTSSFNTDDNIDLSASSLNDTVDLESKKKIIRCLNELKRLLCREGYISNGNNILFPEIMCFTPKSPFLTFWLTLAF